MELAYVSKILQRDMMGMSKPIEVRNYHTIKNRCIQ